MSMAMAAFQGNAFALLEGDEGENLFPAAAPLKAAPPPSPANNHRIKSPASSHEHNSRNGLDRQNRNKDAVERFNRNGAVERHNGNGTNANKSNGAVERHNRNGGGHAYNGDVGYRRVWRPSSNNLKPTNGVSNGKEKKEEEEEGWETVVRAKASKQSSNFYANYRGRRGYRRSYFNANSRGHSTSSNGRNPNENGDGSLHRRRESVKVVENGGNDDKLLHENEAQRDETFDKEEKVLSKEEIERLKLEAEKLAKFEARKLEYELEAKKMTLKQYEKLLEENRKVLESMKTSEERRVEVDTSFNSMHVIAKKKNIEQDNFAKLKKVPSNNKDNNNNNNSVKPKKSYPRRDTSSKSETIPIPVSAGKGLSPPIPLFEDVDQFPALISDATTKRK